MAVILKCITEPHFMTMKFYKPLLLLIAAAHCGTSIATECTAAALYAPATGDTHLVCDDQLSALFGYDVSAKQPVWAVYDVSNTPFNGFIENRGVNKYIPNLAMNKQQNYENTKGVDKAYLVAPYLLLKNERYLENTFALNNIIPINKEMWRGDLREVLFALDRLERNMVASKGGVTAIHGAIGGRGTAPPTHLYRVYYQHQYGLSLAFLMPIKSPMVLDVEHYITSIDCIEKTGQINLFAQLPVEVQLDLENKTATSTDVWARLDGIKEGSICDY